MTGRDADRPAGERAVPPEARKPGQAPMPGTTHDPNSVTTGTEVEPKGDVFPPPGTER